MIEKPSDDAEDLSPTHILYWLQEANSLKHTADLCWDADTDMLKRTREAKLLGVGQSLLQSAQDAEAELNWLYRILVSFAIQHMAIGLLIDRNVHRFQKEAPGYRIVALLDECGFSVNALQKDIFMDMNNSHRIKLIQQM